MTKRIYTAHDLRTALKSAGLPASRTQLWKWEKEGLIPRPKDHLEYQNRPPQRIYTQGEIDRIIEIVRKREEAKVTKL